MCEVLYLGGAPPGYTSKATRVHPGSATSALLRRDVPGYFESSLDDVAFVSA